ncbi:MAG: phosphoenolpyruvate synthase, partial [Muribaculaceae bacterium]
PGRWGSSDTALGIPVRWPHISQAKLIVECAINNYNIEPSQGTHFFQNLTSFGVGYFSINPFNDEGSFDIDYLNSLEAVTETNFVRVVAFSSPVIVKINGKKNIGAVLKPNKQ